MQRPTQKICSWVLILSALLTGCQPIQPFYLNDDGDLSHYLDAATEIEYTDVGQEPLAEVSQAHAPRTISNPQFEEFWDLTLEDAISIALQNSKVIRTYGQVRQFGQIVGNAPERLSAAPDSVATIYDPAIQETGQSGVEQALSAFDAVFSSTANWDSSDRNQNFPTSAAVVNPQSLQQDRVELNNEFSKLSANGTQWFMRNVSIYTGANNQLSRNARDVPSDWFTALETEFRQPLLRNRGTQINRAPVVLARIRTDLALVDFEVSVRELLSSTEQAYWELYFFYHNLRAAKIGRDSAQAAWQKVQSLYEEGVPGGEAEREAQAKEQYFFFRGRVEQAQRDLFKAETRLRYLMGLTPTDDRLIRPADSPTAARVTFDWNMIHEEAMARSYELRRQGWRIRQRELELIAARNQLLPQFDVVALYRWLGAGEAFNGTNRPQAPFTPPPSPGNRTPNQINFPRSATEEFWGGDYQEFRLGFDFNMALGFRRELAQIRSSQLTVARERAKLEDMELEITHQLTDAIQSLDAGYRALRTNFGRRVAAEQQVLAVDAAYIAGTAGLDLLLDAQRRQADANITYYQALVDYNLAIRLVHYRKASLMEYNGVMLAEGPWPQKAYFDAVNQARRRDASYYLNYGFSRPSVISRGPASERWKGTTPSSSPVESLEPLVLQPPRVPEDVDEPEDADVPAEADRGQPQDLSEALDQALDAVTRPGGTAENSLREDLPQPSRQMDLEPPQAPQLRRPADEVPRQIQPKSDSDLQFENPLEAGRRIRTAESTIRIDIQPEPKRERNPVRKASHNAAVEIQWRD